jgi:cytochrome c oxidase subunit 2
MTRKFLHVIGALVLLASVACESRTSKAELEAARISGIPDPPPGAVALRLSFEYESTSQLGLGIQVHEPTPEIDTIWATESLPKGIDMPVGPAIVDRTVFLKPGESRMVALAYKNPVGQDVSFLIAPHQDAPSNLASHVDFKCLCFPTFNQVPYKVPAEGSWYKVIQVGVGSDMPAGSRLDSLYKVLFGSPKTTANLTIPSMAGARSTSGMDGLTGVELGRSLAARNGCASCHSAGGGPGVGPTNYVGTPWDGLFGREVVLENGSRVTADEAYLRESIIDPNAKIVKGFLAGIMPQGFGDRLSPEDIQALIEYIKAIK